MKFHFKRRKSGLRRIEMVANAEGRATRSRVSITGPIPVEPPSLSRPRGPRTSRDHQLSTTDSPLRLQNVSIPTRKPTSGQRDSRQESMNGIEVITLSDSDSDIDGRPFNPPSNVSRRRSLNNVPRRATRQMVANLGDSEETTREFFAALPMDKSRPRKPRHSEAAAEDPILQVSGDNLRNRLTGRFARGSESAEKGNGSADHAVEAAMPSNVEGLKRKRGRPRMDASRQHQQQQTTTARRGPNSPATTMDPPHPGPPTMNSAPMAPMAPMNSIGLNPATPLPRMGTFAPTTQIATPSQHPAAHLSQTNTAQATPLKTPSTAKIPIYDKFAYCSRLSKSKAVRRDSYDPKTIVRDILVVLGRHPTMAPLNDHLHVLVDKGIVPKDADLSTLDWDAIEALSPLASGEPDVDEVPIPANSTLFRKEFRGPLSIGTTNSAPAPAPAPKGRSTTVPGPVSKSTPSKASNTPSKRAQPQESTMPTESAQPASAATPKSNRTQATVPGSQDGGSARKANRTQGLLHASISLANGSLSGPEMNDPTAVDKSAPSPLKSRKSARRYVRSVPNHHGYPY